MPGRATRGEPAPGGVLFGKYEVIRQLGRGGLGTVWLVRHRELNTLRALKLIGDGSTGDPETRSRFRREAEVMARFVHPHAVSVHDSRGVASAGDETFIEMEYVRGQPLSKFLRMGEPMPLGWIARILEQLCDVLQVASDKGIVHRDLKPSNLMLLDGLPPGREHLKVLDFGIAKLVGDDARRESTLKTIGYLGTPSYSSPEQCKGHDHPDTPIDIRSDLYSVGVILYEWLTGHRPFAGDPLCVLHDQIHKPAPPFAAKAKFVEGGPALERFTLRCLAKSPTKRPQTPRQFYREFLDAIAKDDPTWRPDPSTKLLDGDAPGTAGSPSKSGSPRGLAIPSAIACMAIALALIVGLVFGRRPGDDEQGEPPRAGPAPRQVAAAAPAPAAPRIDEGDRARTGEGRGDDAHQPLPEKPPRSIEDDLREYRLGGTEAGRLDWLARTAPARVEEWHRKALAGDPGAQFLYAASLAAGAGVPKDMAGAASWYEKAVDLGEPHAMVALGACYESGSGVPRDPTRAANLYREAARLGHEPGSIALAQLEARPIEMPPIERPAAGNAVVGEEDAAPEAPAESDNPLTGLGSSAPASPQSRKDYDRCLAFGAEAGKRDAFIRENIAHLDDWEADAIAGKPWAQYLLAKCRLAGIGISENPAEAVRLFLKAAAAGDPLSMKELGACYESGIGVEADSTASKRWYMKARKLLPTSD